MPSLRACGVVAIGEDVLALLAHDDGGAGVLAGWQLARGGGDGVLKMRVDDEAIVVGGFGVIQFFAELLKMTAAEIEARHR